MTIAAGSKSRVAYVAETAFGATPTTPTFLEMRRTNGNLQTKKTTVVSDEVHLDRRTRAIYQTGQDVSGSYDFEFSYGSLDDLLAGALQSAWVSDVLTDGSTQKSFTFEETVDLGGTFSYSRFIGCEVSSLALTLASRAGVKGSVSIMGKSELLDTAIVTGATYTAPNSNLVETAVNVASLSIASLSSPKIKNLSLNFANNLRVRDRVGSLYSEEFGTGTCDITGSFDAYFESNALYQAVLDHGGGALSLVIGGTAAKKYSISLPSVKFLDGTRKLGGRNDDVMVTVPFQAIGDASNSLITITRAVA